MAGNSVWRSNEVLFTALGGTTTFNQNSPGQDNIDTINAGETLTRTFAAIDAYIIQSATSPTIVNGGGWWEDVQIAVGLYIPNVLGHNASTPTPLNTADDFWIFQSMLVLDRVTMYQDKSLVIPHYKFPEGRVDVESRQGPAPGPGPFNIQFAWAWIVPFGFQYTTGPSFDSIIGCRFWCRNLFLHG